MMINSLCGLRVDDCALPVTCHQNPELYCPRLAVLFKKKGLNMMSFYKYLVDALEWSFYEQRKLDIAALIVFK